MYISLDRKLNFSTFECGIIINNGLVTLYKFKEIEDN